MHVELVTIGDELLLGFTLDTNAAHLARALAPIGVEIVRHTTVGDAADAIAVAVREALARTGAVITTGGLGPTSDDRTRPAIAALLGRTLHLDADILADITRRFRALGRSGSLPAGNEAQAMVPDGARVLPNAHGTAPGLWLEDEHQRWVVMLPGVPRELRAMVADTLVPLLAARAEGHPAVVRSRTVRTTGIGESALAERVGAAVGEVAGLPVAYLPGWEGTDLRLTARGYPAAAADAVLREGVRLLRARAGDYAYGEDAADLAAVVLDVCRAHGVRLATAESCTGGLLGGRLTAVADASEVYVGGVVAYDNPVKARLLGVHADTLRAHGAVSEAVAREMAAGACAALEVDAAMAITGIAGPGGGSAEKPVGTVWAAVCVHGLTRAERRVHPGDRAEIRLRATQAALDLLRRTLSTLHAGERRAARS